MELLTTVKDFVKDIRHHHLSPETSIRVIIYDPINQEQGQREQIVFPGITPEEQRQLLNDIPCEYEPNASEELIDLIEQSHINTNTKVL